MNPGHVIYLGKLKDLYLQTYAEETQSFKDVQEVDLTVWDDVMIRSLIKDNFGEHVLYAYDVVLPYAFKADLARLCILYIHGGWYSDLGIKFLNKIISDKDIVVFNDNGLKTIFGYDHAIQNSIIYSIPRQAEILESIENIAEMFGGKLYGDLPADPGGTVQMGKVFQQPTDRIGIGEMGQEFTTLEDLESGKTILSYVYEGTHVANFKDFKKRDLIPLLEPDRMLWGHAWEHKKVYA